MKGIAEGRSTTGLGGREKRWSGLTIAFLGILLGAVTGLRAQGVRYDNIVRGPRGGPVASATVAVCAAGARTSTTPCSPLATVYSDEALTQPMANPFPADARGDYGFWAAPGHYVVQIYGAGVTTGAMKVFLPCDRSDCSVANATFSSITAGTLNLTGSLTVNGRAVATEPKPGDAVMYVSPNGSDANNGLSWGSAKQTLYAAVSAVENPTVGGGTIYVAANTACGGPVGGQGLWLVGDDDPAHTSPPAGWIYAEWPLRIIGVGTTGWLSNASESAVSLNCGSGTAANEPGLWLSGTNRPMYFANLSFPANYSNGLRLGVSTTGRLSNTGATTVAFSNVQFSADQNTVSGPAVDIGSNVFWVWFKHSTFQANAGAPGLSDQHQAVVVYSGAVGSCTAQSGLLFFDHTELNNGGVHFYGNCQDGGSMTVSDLTTENQNDGGPAVWITPGAGKLPSGIFRINDVTVADATVNPTLAVKVDATDSSNALGDAGSVTVSNAYGYGQNVSGPMTILSQYQANLQNVTQEPSAQGAVGFEGGHVYGQVDAARRLFPPVASRWSNQVSTLPSSWSISSDGTVTKSDVTGLDGARNAALDISQTGGSYQPAVNFDDSNRTYAAGDYLIVGGWYRSVSGGGPTAFTFSLGSPCGTTPVYGGQYFGSDLRGDGQWVWSSSAFKVTTGGRCQTNFAGSYDASHEMQFFGPVEIHVPAGQISQNEAADIAQNLASFPGGLNSPVEATLRGLPFAFGGSGDNSFATLDHTTLTANRRFSFPNMNGTVALALSGATGAIGGSALARGACRTGTASVSGATTSMAVVASPSADPGTGLAWEGWVSAAGTVTVRVCNISGASVTPAPVTYNVRVVQ